MNFLGRLFNYNNIGKKIKGVAMAVFGIGAFVSVFGSLAWEAKMINLGGLYWWIPILTFFGGPFLAWIISWFFHAYGECAEACDSRLRVAQEKVTKGAGSLLKYDCLGGKLRIVAEIQFLLGALAAIATAAIWEASIIRTGVGVWWLPLVLLIVGPFISWISSWFIYGYADISDAAVLRIGEATQHPFREFGRWIRFDNVANKIKCAAIVSFYVIATVALVGGIGLAVSLLVRNVKMWWLPLPILVGTIVAALIGSWILYAYGNIVSAASAKIAQSEKEEAFTVGDVFRERHTGKKIKGLAVAFVVLSWISVTVAWISYLNHQGFAWLMIPLIVVDVLSSVVVGWQIYGFGELVQAANLKVRECTGDTRVLFVQGNKEKEKSKLMDLFNYDNVGKKIKWLAIVMFILAVVEFLASAIAGVITAVLGLTLVSLALALVIPFVESSVVYAIGEVAEAGSTMLCDMPVETKVRADGRVYCGKCWKEISEETEKCPYCGSVL